MSGIENKVVVITGASSGIGEATARVLAERGARVVIGARRVDRLEALASEITKRGGIVAFKALDVTRLNDVQAFVDFAREKFGRVDVVVNNAGVMPLSRFESLKVDEWNRMIDVNIRGVLHGIAAALPGMKKQGGGQFINVASIAAHAVWPTCGVYCATKYAVLALSDALRQENGKDGVRVTVISPGVTTSELADSITEPESKANMRDFRAKAIPAEAIARSIAYAIEQPAEVDVSEVIVRPVGGA